MVKHFKVLEEVVLVGDKPSWYKGKHVKAANALPHPASNIVNKMRIGLQGREAALWCADDHFALQDFNASLPYYYSGTIAAQKVADPMIRRLNRQMPGYWLNGIVHCPMVVEAAQFNLIFPNNDPKLIRTEYINAHWHRHTVDVPDLKFRGVSFNIMEKLKGRPFFSTCDNAMTGDMLSVLETLYPIPSLYE